MKRRSAHARDHVLLPPASDGDDTAGRAAPLFHPYEIVVCGYSGSGKTTLLEKLIRALSVERRVGYVKHDAHGFEMDRPGKDTHRATQAGAADVFISDASGMARLSARAPGVFEQRYALLDCDWLLIEGYKNSAGPKILLLDADGRAESEWHAGRFENVLAVVVPDSAALPGPGVRFHRDDVAGIADFIRAYFHRLAAHTPVCGLVLAGGRSTRMQRAKWALEYHGEPHALYLHRLLAERCERAYLSLCAGQSADPALADVPAIADRFVDFGPLGGIVSAMFHQPHAAWLVVACDLPYVDGGTIDRLLARRAPFRFATSYRSPHDGLPEPVCTIYEPKSRMRLLQTLGLGYQCPRKVLLNAEIELIDPEHPRELINANIPVEYEEAARSFAPGIPAREGI
jgi:molybdenum cofactor guanylyltransferase